MRKTIITLCAFAVWAASGLAVEQPETSKLEFVTEYISGLAALENIRESGETGVQTSGGRCSLHQRDPHEHAHATRTADANTHVACNAPERALRLRDSEHYDVL